MVLLCPGSRDESQGDCELIYIRIWVWFSNQFKEDIGKILKYFVGDNVSFHIILFKHFIPSC